MSTSPTTRVARLAAVATAGLLLLGACGKKAATSSSASTVKIKSPAGATTAPAKGATTTAGKTGSTSTGTTVKGGTSKGKVPASLPTVPAPATTRKTGTGSLATLKPVNTVRQASTIPPVTVASGKAPAKPDDRNCGDFADWSEAKQFFDTYYPYYGDVANLDGDGDGIPCESLPGSPK
jgi:Excalibur calcium-binding domain